MQVSFIIQARVGSSRLPNKILLPFYNDKCILGLLVEKLKQIPDTQIIIATSTNPENDVIAEFCKKFEVNCFRGSENDVLKRFIDAAEAYKADKIIRVCSDNPFIELESIKRIVDRGTKSDADYISFNINGNPSIKTHFGFWTEFVTLDALKRVNQSTDESIYHEHVTNYIYTHPENFTIEWIDGPNCLNNRDDIRLTCDTSSDFNSSKEIYQNLCKSNPYPKISEIVNYLESHEEYLTKMKEQIKRNTK
jgi:hypothetical protein